jgi:hypothetical protein
MPKAWLDPKCDGILPHIGNREANRESKMFLKHILKTQILCRSSGYPYQFIGSGCCHFTQNIFEEELGEIYL